MTWSNKSWVKRKGRTWSGQGGDVDLWALAEVTQSVTLNMSVSLLIFHEWIEESSCCVRGCHAQRTMVCELKLKNVYFKWWKCIKTHSNPSGSRRVPHIHLASWKTTRSWVFRKGKWLSWKLGVIHQGEMNSKPESLSNEYFRNFAPSVPGRVRAWLWP